MDTTKIADDFYVVRDKELKWGVDATPDGGYAIRILQAYLEDCQAYWSDNSEGKPPKNDLCTLLNKVNEERKKELSKAIVTLVANR